MTDSPKKFGKYEATGHLGAGAMGVVWRAQDPVLGRTVAIKTISATLGADNDNKERFLREARAAAQLNHPNIITVYDFGQADDELYMAMELLEGKDLKELIAGGQLSFEQKLNIMEQVADGLAYAHSREVVHRDLKPGNIHVQPNGQVKILDFGLARLGSSDLTKTGVVMGTPNYMSPEQVMGERADTRSDVFSSGAVFYELLTNRKPFDAESVHATLYQVVHRDPPPPRQWDPRLPEGLVAIIETAMTKQVAGRYKDGRALHDAIRAFRYGEEPEFVELEESAPASGDVESDETSINPSLANASSANLSKTPQPFRSYGRSGSSPSASVAPSAGISAAGQTTGRVPRIGSTPPTPGSDLSQVSPSASVIAAPAPAPSMMPKIVGGAAALILVAALGYFVAGRGTPKETGPSNLDALAANLVESQLDMARRALSDKDYKGAVEQAGRVLKLEPSNPEAMGIREQAQSAIAEIDTWVGVARSAMSRGESAQATAALEHIMARDPKNPIVSEMSNQLNSSFQAKATQARDEMDKARALAEAKEGAASEASFAEGDEFANTGNQAFDAGEFTAATQAFLQAHDAYERARRLAGTAASSTRSADPGARPVRPPAGSSSAALPPSTTTSAPAESAPTAAPAAAPAQTQAAPAAAASGAGEARDLQTGSTTVEGTDPKEFEGKFEFEVQPNPLRVGSPFRIRVFLRNTGKKDAKLDRLTARVSRNGDASTPDSKIVEDSVKAGQRPMIAEIPGRASGKSLFLPAGTSSWSLDVEATSRKGERIRATLSMKQP